VSAWRAIAGVLVGSLTGASILVLAMPSLDPCIGASRFDICSTDGVEWPPCYLGVCDVFEPWGWKLFRPVFLIGMFAAAGAIAQGISRDRLLVAATATGALTVWVATEAANYIYPYGSNPDPEPSTDLLGYVFWAVLTAAGAAGGWLFARATRER
jgi:hypothetical protein